MSPPLHPLFTPVLLANSLKRHETISKGHRQCDDEEEEKEEEEEEEEEEEDKYCMILNASGKSSSVKARLHKRWRG